MKKLMTLMIALFVAGAAYPDGSADIVFDGKELVFTWYQGFGTPESAVDINGNPYNTDGGYFVAYLTALAFKHGDQDMPVSTYVKFSDVFEELSIGDITYHFDDDPEAFNSKRLYADFTGEEYDDGEEIIYGTRVLSDNEENGYTLRGTLLNGQLFYGIMFDQDGDPYMSPVGKDGDDVSHVSLNWVASVFPDPGGGSLTEKLPVKYKRKEGAGGGYMLAIAFFDEFRDDAGNPDAEFDDFVGFADRPPVYFKNYFLRVYNETQHIYYENIEDALADGIINPGDIINIPGGIYSGDLNTSSLGGVTLYPGDSPACVTILGSFDVTDEDNLIIDIESDEPACPGPDPGYTRLTIDGSANLNDISLDIQLAYLPVVGDEFLIIDVNASGTLTGEFNQGAEIVVEYNGFNVTFSIEYDTTDNNVTLEVTDVTELPPIPLANWALYLGFILMAVFVAIRFRGRIL